MTCVPQKPDDGSYPVPTKDQLVQSFDTKLWNGRWYITAGQNKLFDTFPCQVHFFTEVSSCMISFLIQCFDDALKYNKLFDHSLW